MVEGASTIDLARSALVRGRTVAVKGLGGFHLACDATSDEAIGRLRARKHRPEKPFAIMLRNLVQAEEFAEISSGEAALLQSPARPIVLLQARRRSSLSELVAPGNPLIGIMLAYTPVQHLLLDGSMPPLVMTSANLGGTPITYHDDDVELLKTLSDAVLTHDRPIHVPCDDSVVRLLGDRLLPIRRARGYAPIPVAMPGGRRSVLAVGGELKNTFCVASGGHAWVSQHIGDMENLETLDAFDATVELFETMYAVTPELVAVDAHPGYLSSKLARTSGRGPVLEVQHHHAHVAAVMAEHGLDPHEPVIGIRLRRHGVRRRRHDLGRRSDDRRRRRVRTGGAPRRTCRCPVATPRSAIRAGSRSPTCGRPTWIGTDELAPVAALDEVELEAPASAARP